MTNFYAFVSDETSKEKDEAMGNNFSSLTSLTKDAGDGYRYKAKFSGEKIGEGTCRMAYKGRYVKSSLPGGPMVNKECVAKIFKKEYAWIYDSYDKSDPTLKAYRRATKMADKFNRVPKSDSRTVRVLTPVTVEIDRPGVFFTYFGCGTFLLW